MPRKKQTGGLSEQMKIRYYVMNLIYRSGGQPHRIPSSCELAKKFGVARSTVQLALSTLLEQKFLIGYPGRGTFTNPDQGFILPMEDRTPLIGILEDSGDYFYTSPTAWHCIGAVCEAIASYGYNLHWISDCDPDRVSLDDMFRNYHLDLLINIRYGARCRKPLGNQPFMVIGYTDPGPDVCAIRLCHESAFEQILQVLIREKRYRLVNLCRSGQYVRSDDFFAYLKRRAPEIPFEIDSVFPEHLEEEAAVLRSYLNRCTPDAIFLHSQKASQIMEVLNEKTVDLHSKCRLFAYEWVPEHVPFLGYCVADPMREVASIVMKMISDSIPHGIPLPKQTVFVDKQLVFADHRINYKEEK